MNGGEEILDPSERGYVFYSEPQLSGAFLSDPTPSDTILDSSGYALTGAFFDLVVSGPILPDSVLNQFRLSDLSGFVDLLLSEWGSVFTHSAAMAVLTTVGFLMTVGVAVVGIAWCIMHRRGKWGGGRTEWKEDWASKVTRQVALSFFFALWAVSLWGLVWHFAADRIMEGGFDRIVENVDLVARDAQIYLNNTAEQVRHWQEINFEQELKPGFEASVALTASGMDSALSELNEPQNTVMTRITALPPFLLAQMHIFEVSERERIGNLLSDLHFWGNQVDDAYVQLKETEEARWERLLMPSACHPNCERLQIMAAALVYEIGLTSNPDEVSSIQITQEDHDLVNEMWDETRVFHDQLQRLGGDFVNDNMDLVDSTLEGFEEFFLAGWREMTGLTDGLQFDEPGLGEDAEELFDLYFNLVSYFFIVPAVVMTFVLALYFAGYIVGVFGEVGGTLRTRYASKMLWAGTLLFFVFASLFWLMTTLLFASGTVAQKLYCDTLQETEDSELYPAFEKDLSSELRRVLNNPGFKETEWIVPDMLEQCEDGKSLYDILHMEDAYDIDLLRAWRAYVDVKNIEGQMLSRLNDTAYQVAPYLEFQDDTIEPRMLDLQVKLLPIIDDYIDDYIDYVFDDVIRQDTVANLSTALGEVLASLDSRSQEAEDASELMSLTDTILELIPDFEDKYWVTHTHAELYDEQVTLTTISVFEVIDETFLTWIVVSQDQLLANLDILAEELIEDFEDTLALFDWFADYSVGYLKEDLGECFDAYDTYLAGINYTCDMLVDPLNSVWSGLGLILVAFVPLLLCAMKVEGVFRAVLPEDVSVIVDMAWPGGMKAGAKGMQDLETSSEGSSTRKPVMEEVTTTSDSGSSGY